MKTLLFVSILGLMACGSEKDEAPVVERIEVSALLCMDRCIALNEAEGFSLADAGMVCRGSFTSDSKCCEYKDLPFYRECK